MLKWDDLDTVTRAGFIAAVVAWVAILIPPIAVLSALVAGVCSTIAWRRARSSGESNPVAKYSLLAVVALLALLVVGTVIYGLSGGAA